MKPAATSLVSCSIAEVFECLGRNLCLSATGSRYALTVVTVVQSSEIGRYEVPREVSLPDDFQISGIRHDLTESFKSAMRYSIALGLRLFR